MSVKAKEKFTKINKILGGLFFALLLFTNIKLAILDNPDEGISSLSLDNLEFQLFESTYAQMEVDSGHYVWSGIIIGYYNGEPVYRYNCEVFGYECTQAGSGF